MKAIIFAKRCLKEIIRDPLSVVFGVGLPAVLLVIMTILKKSIKDMPEEMFALDTFTPGMIVFGLSFIMLFLGMLVMNDRCSSFLLRLYSSPMKAAHYISGYILPMIPIGVLQTFFCFVVAAILGMKISVNMLAAMITTIPVTLMFSSLGLLLGAIFSTPAVNGISSLIINVSALLSGTWFSLDMVGGGFRTFCNFLPFAHCVNVVTGALASEYSAFFADILWILAYALLFLIIGTLIFRKRMKN